MSENHIPKLKSNNNDEYPQSTFIRVSKQQLT